MVVQIFGGLGGCTVSFGSVVLQLGFRSVGAVGPEGNYCGLSSCSSFGLRNPQTWVEMEDCRFLRSLEHVMWALESQF